MSYAHAYTMDMVDHVDLLIGSDPEQDNFPERLRGDTIGGSPTFANSKAGGLFALAPRLVGNWINGEGERL